MTLRWPFLVVMVACTSPDTPAEQLQRGAHVYRRECEYCHDVEGAIGVELSSNSLASYGSARRLFNYIQLAMPYQAPRTLPEGDYWDVVAYLVAKHSLTNATIVIDSSNADSVRF